MKKKIIPFIILTLIFSLLIGCSGNLSSEFHSSVNLFKESHLNSNGLRTDLLSGSKSMEIETVGSWFLNLEKTKEIASFELSKGIYKSLPYAQETENSKPPEKTIDNYEDITSNADAKLYYLLITQQATAEDTIF